MPRPVCPNMTTAAHLGPPGPRRHRDGAEAARRVARTGRAAIRCQESIFPRARHGRSCLGAAGLNSGHLRGIGPPNRDLCQRPVSTSSWRYGLRRTCRLVTGRSHRPRSTWPDQARPPLLAVTHRYKRAHCLWPEQFQIRLCARDLGRDPSAGDVQNARIWLVSPGGPRCGAGTGWALRCRPLCCTSSSLGRCPKKTSRCCCA